MNENKSRRCLIFYVYPLGWDGALSDCCSLEICTGTRKINFNIYMIVLIICILKQNREIKCKNADSSVCIM